MRFAFWLAWTLAAYTFVLCGAALVLYPLIRSAEPPSTWGTGGFSAALIFLLPFLAFPVVGALIASRRPGNPIGWICLACGIIWMFAMFSGFYSTYGLVQRPGSVPFPAAVGSLSEWIWIPAVGLLGTFLILLFPDGRLPSRRWRPLALACGLVIAVASLGIALEPGPLSFSNGTLNPFGLQGYSWVLELLGRSLILLPLCILASAVSLLVRFVYSDRLQRQQIKWIAVAAAAVGVAYLAVLLAEGVFIPGVEEGGQPLWAKLLEDAVTLSYAGVPIAVGFAVLRYRLYDIDIVINRALVYGSLTATLVAVYFAVVVVLQRTFILLTGGESTLAVVASTLAIAALFNPMRHRFQAAIDRLFYRNKYDAAKTLETFSARLREETDLKALSDDLVAAIRKTMQPAHASLWLRPPGAREATPMRTLPPIIAREQKASA